MFFTDTVLCQYLKMKNSEAYARICIAWRKLFTKSIQRIESGGAWISGFAPVIRKVVCKLLMIHLVVDSKPSKYIFYDTSLKFAINLHNTVSQYLKSVLIRTDQFSHVNDVRETIQ